MLDGAPSQAASVAHRARSVTGVMSFTAGELCDLRKYAILW